MLRLRLIGLLFVVVSCGQNGSGNTVNTTPDSAVGPTSPGSSLPAGQQVKHQAYKDDVEGLPAPVAQFVPAGYTALDTTSGDLNLDRYPDMILVLKKNGEDTTSDVIDHPEKRPLLILLGQADNTFKLAARSDNAVYCIDCGGMMGDPFTQVVIRDGYFSVEHYGGSSWRWTRTITFRYSPADNYWYLHKDGGDSYHAAEPEKVSTKVRTTKDFGKVPFDKFDIYKEE